MTGTEVLMAGFGGQGMLLAGKILAHAAMTQGLEVSWLPSLRPGDARRHGQRDRLHLGEADRVAADHEPARRCW